MKTTSNSKILFPKQTQFEKWNQEHPVLDPYGQFYIIWRIINTAFIIYFMFQIPLLISFDRQFYEDQNSYIGTQTVNILAILTFFLDVGVTLNVGYYDAGLFISNRKQILKRYFKSYLFIDILSMIVVWLSYLTFSPIVNIIKILFVLKFFKLGAFDKDFIYLLKSKKKSRFIYRFSRLLLIILFYTHIFACFYYWIDHALYLDNNTKYIENGMLWLLTAPCWQNVINLNWAGRYLYAFYWSVGTVSTIGYGDIFPQNPYQNLYLLLVVIQICILFGYMVNNIFNILTQYYYVEQKLVTSLHSANFYFQQKKLPFQLRYKIRRYIEYVIKQQGFRNKQEEDQIFSNFSKDAFARICYQKYKELLNRLPKTYIGSKGMMMLGVKVVSHTNFQDDEVCTNKQSIYMVNTGRILQYYKVGINIYPTIKLRSKKIIKKYQFMTGFDSCKCYKSLYYTEIIELNRNDFLEYLDFESKQKIRMQIQSIILQKNVKHLQLQCLICNKGHFESQCAKIHYDKDQIKNGNRMNQRSKYLRKKYGKNNRRTDNQYMDNKNQLFGKRKVLPQILTDVFTFLTQNQSAVQYQQSIEKFNFYYPNHNLFTIKFDS